MPINFKDFLGAVQPVTFFIHLGNIDHDDVNGIHEFQEVSLENRHTNEKLVIKDGHEGEGHFHAVQLRQRRIGLKK
jgi:hypothetical protein